MSVRQDMEYVWPVTVLLESFITGDESWVFRYDPETTKGTYFESVDDIKTRSSNRCSVRPQDGYVCGMLSRVVEEDEQVRSGGSTLKEQLDKSSICIGIKAF